MVDPSPGHEAQSKWIWMLIVNSVGVRISKVVPINRYKSIKEEEGPPVGLCSGAYWLPFSGPQMCPGILGDGVSEVLIMPVFESLRPILYAPGNTMCAVDLLDKDGERYAGCSRG